MKKNKTMIICFILPCLLTLFIMYLYPVARTLIMSFFRIESVTSDVSTWSFYGLGNYSRIFGSPTYRVSMWNMLRIWLVGGIFTLSFSLLFAVILTSGIRFKKFFRAAIYLPNVISAVALATMWIQYVYNNDYGMLNKILGALGLNGVKWLGTDTKFWAMLFAFIFGAVGYYMLIFISGIERIPQDLYEAATIDGAGQIQQFAKITFPLLRGTHYTLFIMGMLGSLKCFDLPYVLTRGGPNYATEFFSTYIYKQSFNLFKQGPASAIVMVMFAIAMVITLIQLKFYYRNDKDKELAG